MTHTMTDHRIYLLGAPRIERDGAALTIERRKALAVLAYLAITRTAVSRERLAALLWPDADSSSGFAYLRTTLWALNKGLGEDWARSEAGTLRFNPDANIWLDTVQFAALVNASAVYSVEGTALHERIAQLNMAVMLYRDEFMAGFTIPDSPDFDEWQFLQREGFKRQLAQVLEQLAAACAQVGDFERGMQAARRWVALDTLHEPAQRQLMQLYAWAGQQSAALRQYQELVRLLDSELGTTPEDETTALYESIQARRLAPPTLEPPAKSGAISQLPAAVTAPALRRTQEVQNIPREGTPFVGRDADIAEITRLLSEPDCRMLTLLGPGGIGKTRLAMAAAEAFAQHEYFADGVYFVGLVGVQSADFLANKVLEAVTSPQEGDIKDQLFTALAEKRLLLVLDNFEHLLAGVDILVELLANAPTLKLLITSRERLNVQEEWLYETPGLPYPTVLDAHLTQYDAVQLFVQSARRARPDFVLSSENAAGVLRICALVHGMPLGLELAAAWVQILTCDEIAAEIQTNLDFLSTSLRNIPARHRSLRAVFDTSWGRLAEEEQRVLSRLTVFRAGFTAEAARAVAGASPHLLLTLVGKSLLARDGGFQIHELLRQFAEGKLDETARPQVQARHCDYFGSYLAAQLPLLQDARQAQGLDAIQAVMDDVRGAWFTAVHLRRIEPLRQMIEPLYHYYIVRGQALEFTDLLRCALEGIGSPQDDAEHLLLGVLLALMARRMYWAGDIVMMEALITRALPIMDRFEGHPDTALPLSILGALRNAPERPYEEADALFRRALAIYEAHGNSYGVAQMLGRIGANLQNHIRYSEAYEFFQRSLALFRELGNPGGQAGILGWLADNVSTLGDHDGFVAYLAQQVPLYEQIGDHMRLLHVRNSVTKFTTHDSDAYEEVVSNLQQSLAISRQNGQRRDIAWKLYNIGFIHLLHERYSEALAYYGEALELFRAMNDLEGTTWSLNFMAAAYVGDGELSLAERLVGEALEILEDVTFPWSKAGALFVLGDIYLARRDLAQARAYYAQSVQIAHEVQSVMQVMRHLGGLADWLIASGDARAAAELAAFVRENQATDLPARKRAGGTLALAAQTLSAAALAEAQEAAKRRTLEWVVDAFIAQ